MGDDPLLAGCGGSPRRSQARVAAGAARLGVATVLSRHDRAPRIRDAVERMLADGSAARLAAENAARLRAVNAVATAADAVEARLRDAVDT